MGRLARVVILGCFTALAAVGIVAAYRAYSPVAGVEILLTEPAIRAGSGIRVDTLSSGRGPLSIRVELVQGGRSSTVALERVTSRRRAYWDLRTVRHSTYSVVSRSLLERFTPGRAAVRATVVGPPAWLRQPPPVVQEISVQIELEQETK